MAATDCSLSHFNVFFSDNIAEYHWRLDAAVLVLVKDNTACKNNTFNQALPIFHSSLNG